MFNSTIKNQFAFAIAALLTIQGTTATAQTFINGPDGHSVTIDNGGKLKINQRPSQKDSGRRQVITPINIDPTFANGVNQRELDRLLQDVARRQINSAIIRRQFGESQRANPGIVGSPAASVPNRVAAPSQPISNAASSRRIAPKKTNTSGPMTIKSPFATFNTPEPIQMASPIPIGPEDSIQPVQDSNGPVRIPNNFSRIDNESR